MMSLIHLFRIKKIWKFQNYFTRALHNPNTGFSKQMSSCDNRRVVTMITGTGIGPELMCHVQEIFIHAEIPVDFESIHITSKKDIDEAMSSIKRNKAAIKSPIESITEEDGKVILPDIYMRQNLDLYLSMVKYHPYCNLPVAKHNDVDLILMRQNTEGEYTMMEHESVKGVVESLKVITRRNSQRFAKRTFEYATKHNRKKVTIVNKANIMKLSDGLFLEEARKVGKDFPKIKHDAMLIDNCCMQLVSNPKQFDVLMMPNLYGSIVGNIMCGLLGGAGLFSGSNLGDKYAIFEPAARKMGKTLVGQNKANPAAMLNAAVELLYYIGLPKYANLLYKAIYTTYCKDNIYTPDLGGKNSSAEVIEQIKENIDSMGCEDD